MKPTAAAVAMGSLLSLGIAASGCGTSAPGSCSVTANGYSVGSAIVTCTDYGDRYTSTTAMSQCVPPAVYSNTSCTTINRLGRCTITTQVGRAVSAVTISYYPTTVTVDAGADGGTMMVPLTADEASAMCSMHTNAALGMTATFEAN